MNLKQIQKQNEDGSIDAQFVLSAEQTHILLHLGINYALQRGLASIVNEIEEKPEEDFKQLLLDLEPAELHQA